MKLTEALAQIFPATVFPDNELSAIQGASALKDIEFPDAVMTKFNSHYMTADRAENDPEISKKLKAKHWGYFADDIERKMKAIVGILPDEWKTKYYAIPETQVNGIYDRIAVLKDAVSEVALKGSGEDVKTASEKFRKVEKELREQITAHEAKIKTQQDEYAAKESGIKMNYALRSKLQGRIPKLDPNLIKTEVHKNFIIDSTINSLQSGYLLEFDKENQSAISFLNKDRTDVYEGNKKVTLDEWIEKQLEPYTVKNNGGTPPPSGPEPKKLTIEKTHGKTLHDLQLEIAQPVV